MPGALTFPQTMKEQLNCLQNLTLFVVSRPIKNLNVSFRVLVPRALTATAKFNAQVSLNSVSKSLVYRATLQEGKGKEYGFWGVNGRYRFLGGGGGGSNLVGL